MRQPIIAGNWKLHKSIPETVELIAALKRELRPGGPEVVVAPVFTALAAAVETAAGSGIRVAAQNCYHQPSGAFTGEVSPQMIRDLGCLDVILGHSERRQLFGETDEFINLKIKAALSAGLRAIFCIGETLDERESEQMYEVLTRQVRVGLAGLDAGMMDQVVVAYEPVWAIGTGVTATTDQAEEAHEFVRGLLAGMFDKPVSEQTRILYGGSVKPDNVDGLMAQANIDGTLVGGASLKAGDFLRIINYQRA